MTEDCRLLTDVSGRVELRWALALLSQLLKEPKKHLRKAFRIIEAPEAQTEIAKKGKLVYRNFHYGFRRFPLEKRGKKREILAPHPELQKMFKAVKRWLDKTFVPHRAQFGFVKNRNPRKAVEALLWNKHFLGFDIADAFPSISDEIIKEALKKLGVEEAIAEILARVVTYSKEDGRALPQGASSSPSLLNLVYRPMCEEIDEICRANGISWIVYADDFNFAGRHISQEVKKNLLAVPLKYGFSIKERKTKDNQGKTIPHMLGLTIVDGKIHITRRRKKEFRRIMYATLAHKAYSPDKVRGIKEAIRVIYGEEQNWPGWLKVKTRKKKISEA